MTVSGGTVNISNNSNNHSVYGGTCTVALNSAGAEQTVYGGTGIITEMEANADYDQFQNISGGTGIVGSMTLSQHHQNITAGYGEVVTMSGGVQKIESGAEGHIQEMHGGTQNVYQASAKGTIDTMYNGASQEGAEGSIVEIGTMSGGTQTVDGTGKIGNMVSGKQTVAGTGKIETMVNGNQTVGWGVAGSSAVGTIQQMSNGMQIIYSGHTGIIESMDGGYQYAGNASYAAGNGMIKVMNSGQQRVFNDGSGTISKMAGSDAMQIIGMSGTAATGSIEVMEAGMQAIGYQNGNFGKGSITSMTSGVQVIGYSGGSGTGSIVSMNGGSQVINNAGTGTVTALLGGEQIVSSGGKAVDTTIAGGTQKINSGGIAVSTTIKAGQQIVSVGAVVSSAVLSGGVQQVYDGTNLHDITFEGGTQAVMDGATVSGMQVTNGVQAVQSGGNAAATSVGADGSLYLTSGGTVSDMTVNSGTMYLGSGGAVSGLTMSGGVLYLESLDGADFAVGGTLTAKNAVIDMTGSYQDGRAVTTPTYENLTINELKGSGTTFIMDTDLAGAANSDRITINSADAGTHYLQIRDLSSLNGIQVTGAKKQLLVNDNSGKLTFAGKKFNNGGLFDIDPTIENIGNAWYLTKIAKPVNNDTKVLLFDADNSYALWRNTNDSLRSRLGELHGDAEHDNGIWARTQAGRFSGLGYEGRYNLYQLGYDKKVDARSTYGFAVDYGDGTGDYTQGSGKDKLTAFSLYGVWQGQRGAYTNVTARAGIFDTDLKSYGDNPDQTSYKEHAYSISVEYGQRFDYQQGLFFEPQAQFTLGRLGGINYTTDRGANGHIESMNSAIGRIGFVLGQKIKNGSDIYLKADLLHEFAGKRDLQLTSDAGGTNDILRKHNDYGDTWFELGLGANIKLSKSSNFYGEIERGFGGDINKKWSVNAGLRFTF